MPLTIDATQVEKLAARGLPADVIADFLGVPRATFKASMPDNPAVDAAWRRGWANLQAKTMEWLVISAKKESVQAQISLADRVLGGRDAAPIPTTRRDESEMLYAPWKRSRMTGFAMWSRSRRNCQRRSGLPLMRRCPEESPSGTRRIVAGAVLRLAGVTRADRSDCSSAFLPPIVILKPPPLQIPTA